MTEGPPDLNDEDAGVTESKQGANQQDAVPTHVRVQ